LAFVPGGAIAKLGGKALGSFEKGSKVIGALEKVGSKIASGADKAASEFNKLTSVVSNGFSKVGSKVDDALGGLKTKLDGLMSRGEQAADDVGGAAANETQDLSKKAIASARRSAVRNAWKDEAEMVKVGKSTRNWSEDEIHELVTKGRIAGYEGHHINSVDWALKHAKDPMSYIRNPDNIRFLTRAEHQAAHGGNFANNTVGWLLSRGI
jgi:ElaB/YqjD/DUF883 family membrane-anchored ribosome-binding protein